MWMKKSQSRHQQISSINRKAGIVTGGVSDIKSQFLFIGYCGEHMGRCGRWEILLPLTDSREEVMTAVSAVDQGTGVVVL